MGDTKGGLPRRRRHPRQRPRTGAGQRTTGCARGPRERPPGVPVHRAVPGRTVAGAPRHRLRRAHRSVRRVRGGGRGRAAAPLPHPLRGRARPGLLRVHATSTSTSRPTTASTPPPTCATLPAPADLRLRHGRRASLPNSSAGSSASSMRSRSTPTPIALGSPRSSTCSPTSRSTSSARSSPAASTSSRPRCRSSVPTSGEMMLPGVHKATGIDVLLAHVGVDRADTIAIGDSYNDLEMLEHVAVGVAMGNAPDAVQGRRRRGDRRRRRGRDPAGLPAPRPDRADRGRPGLSPGAPEPR